MATGFDRLRMAATAGVVGILAGIGGGSRSARAASVAMPVTVTAAGAAWAEFRNSNTGPATFGNGFVMTSGSLTGPGRDDAFDGAMMCKVNGVTYQNPSGNVDRSAVSGGTRITPAVQTVGGLQVQLTYFASSSKPVLRAICSVTNTTGSAIPLTVLMGSNYGSDNQTTIHNSSSGDASVDASDRWFVSSDANPTFGDPVIITGRFGQGAAVIPTLLATPGTPAPPFATDSLVDQFQTSVPAGATVSFMQLVWLNTDVGPANANAPSFDSSATLQAAGLLSDLSPAEIARIANFGPAAATQTQVVPTLSDTGSMALALLVGASGLTYLMRRRRRGEI